MTVRSSSTEWHGNAEGDSVIVTAGDGVFSAADPAAVVTAPRRRPHEGRLRVLVGKERFSENHAWSEMPLHWPSGVADRAVYSTDHLLDCVAGVDSVIISASQQPGRPPLIDDTALRAMRPGVWLVNIARGGLLDADAAIAHLDTGHLAGLGLDVFPTEPYPADGPLAAHPRILATAHTAALTSDYFTAASRRLGDALASYLDHQPPPDSSDERLLPAPRERAI